MIELRAGDFRLELAPERGGSVTALEWRGEALLRPTCGPTVLDTACFPLVPFSNRIAFGRFDADGRRVKLAPNFPGSDHPHPLHGFGWLAQWRVVHADECSVTLEHRYSGGEWPWPYQAQQRFELAGDRLTMTLSVTHLGDTSMPAGLGFHPYFPCDADTVYFGLHRGEWQNDADCLPINLQHRDAPVDWWDGAPVQARNVDTVYTGREGPLAIAWPSRNRSLTILPDPSLPHTVVYSPRGQDFFCVEPVSHSTDAVNAPDPSAIRWLAAQERFEVEISLVPARLGGD